MVPQMYIFEAQDTKDDGGRVPRVWQCSASTGCHICALVSGRARQPSISENDVKFMSCSLPIVYIDVNAVPGKLVYGNGIKVSH